MSVFRPIIYTLPLRVVNFRCVVPCRTRALQRRLGSKIEANSHSSPLVKIMGGVDEMSVANIHEKPRKQLQVYF